MAIKLIYNPFIPSIYRPSKDRIFPTLKKEERLIYQSLHYPFMNVYLNYPDFKIQKHALLQFEFPSNFLNSSIKSISLPHHIY